MQIDIQMGPGSSAAKVSLEPGEILTAEGGAMIAMSGDMSMTTTTHKKKSGGIMKALKRVISGESFFMNHYEPGPNGGDVISKTSGSSSAKNCSRYSIGASHVIPSPA